MSIQPVHILLPQDLRPMMSLEAYRVLGGLKGLERARAMTAEACIVEVQKANLRGRGGAGFPNWIKLQTILQDPCPVKYVVCNSSEGEPGTYKDRYLIQKNPYQLIEGMLILCHVVQARQGIVGIKKKFLKEVRRLKEAVADFEQAGLMKKGYVEIFEGPDDYLFGEEKGLMEAIDTGGALPRVLPPYILGVHGTPASPNPTVVNNAETMSHWTHIFAKGADEFRERGTEDTPGTMIFTLSGDVKRPGMYELPLGLTVRDLLYEIGGGPVGEHPIKMVFAGAANCVITPEMFDAVMDFGSMRKAGSGLGSAGFMVFDESVCAVKAALMFSAFLYESSCGQCVPCKRGTRILTEHLQNIEDGRGTQDDIDVILREVGGMTSQTRCFLPAQAANLVPSVARRFSDEFKRHLQTPCPYPRVPILPQIQSFDEGDGKFIYVNS